MFKTKDGEDQPIDGLVDSGADFTLIPLSSGTLLGLDVQKGEPYKLHPIGGGFIDVYLHKVQVAIGGNTSKILVAVASSDEAGGRPLPVLLGRTDLFDQYDISFRQKAGTLEFSPS